MTTPASVFSSSSFFLPPASSSSSSAAFGGPRTTTNPPGHKPAPMSKIFNAADADITFKSSDGVRFRVHRKNLEVCAEGFPPSEISSTGEVVALTETSATLELLFQFMYPKRHPALDTTPFEVLEPLAEAAEKYQVFPAMNICHIRMRDMVKDHPAPVFVYAAKHDYPYLVSEVAPAMISMSPIEVAKILPPTVLQKTALVLPARHDIQHETGSKHLVQILTRLGVGVHQLRNLDAVFNGVLVGVKVSKYEPFFVSSASATASVSDTASDCYQKEIAAWRKRIEDAIAKIPKFSSFL